MMGFPPYPQEQTRTKTMTVQFSSVDQALRKAKILTRKGTLGEAQAAYRWVLENFPNNKRAIDGLAALHVPQARPKAQALTQEEANGLLALYNQGQFGDALTQANRLVARHPNVPSLHHLQGAILAALGETQQAIGAYRRAVALRPEFPEALMHLGDALNATGQPGEAVPVLQNAVAQKPDFTEAHNALGNALTALGRFEDAATHYRRAIRIDPGCAAAHNNLGTALNGLGDAQGAVESYRAAIAANPDFAGAHSNLGLALTTLGQATEGETSCRTAVGLAPDNAQAHVNLARALDARGEHDAAIESLETAIGLAPKHLGAHNNLLDILDRLNRVDAFRAALQRARAAVGEADPRILYRIAQLAARDKDQATARLYLEKIPEDGHSPAMTEGRLTLLGKSCDKLGDAEAAFRAFAAANDFVASQPAARQCDPVRYRHDIEALTASFAAVSEKPWQDEPSKGRSSPAFLVGFPRSGTTLLDTILRSHPDIAVVEEMPMVARMKGLIGGAAGCDRLEAMTRDEIRTLREAYFAELDKHTGDGERTVIDKLPLNIISAGLIHRVFPDAKFIMALRHPCDCVLSCYMQSFRLNDAMANFLDLESSATLYDRVMRLWSAYRNVLPLDVQEVRYEELIGDLEATARPVLAFLGLEWNDALLNYRETALARGHINTPSYNQVTEKLHRQAAGRWENYRAQLEPVYPLLDSWARTWGY
ncbi:tetratricopeptide repeat-containing sulfotransferase family protein [Oricola nitratireducens]|uniref:tetratricopeptide repeat-containing sulfotransferase family protein n=1 Tax=Oricola nitratireducens TaxID=2775868 RepID=UPI00186907FC|nr:tetratricopeptide repeat-containing sulfotransferase family protein [Oricola nitratireducens]